MKFSDGGTLSPDDIQNRIGKLTASRMKDAMDFLKNGQESAARRKYKADLVAERMTDIMIPHFVTPAMLWGIEQEGAAKAAYKAATGRDIRSASTLDHPDIDWFAATPDGFCEADGLVECKCPTTGKFLEWITAGVVPDEHKPQMLAQLAVTRKSWVDFVAFDPRMPVKQQLFVRRFTPTELEIKAVEMAAMKFLGEVEEMFERVSTSCMI